MRTLTRVIAAFLVATLVIHLGDWPFVDEMLDDLQSQGVFQSAADRSNAGVASSEEGTKAPAGIGVQYSVAFASLAPPFEAATLSHPVLRERYGILQAEATDYIVAGPFKPPAG